MKMPVLWIQTAAVVLMAVLCCVIGLKIFGNDYDVIAEAYIFGVCLIIMVVCCIYRVFNK